MATSDTSNPLLEIQFRIPFDRIRAEHVEPAIRELLEDARVRRWPRRGAAPRTFENTLRALDSMTDRLDYAMGLVRHLEGVATYPELRAAHNAVEPLASEFYSGIPLDEGLWKALGSTRRPRGGGAGRRSPALSHQDHRQLPPPRRGSGRGGQSAPGGDRRRAEQADHALRRRTCSTRPTRSSW